MMIRAREPRQQVCKEGIGHDTFAHDTFALWLISGEDVELRKDENWSNSPGLLDCI